MSARKDAWTGMNWIRQDKRLAIYLRDNLQCVYCGATIEDGAQLTLDHVRPHIKNGSNEASNLVTCCATCNFSRQAMALRSWCAMVSMDTGEASISIRQRVERQTRRSIDSHREKAKTLIHKRGSAARALQHV